MTKKHVSRQFKILVERDEDGYFVATVPALPGCTTQAKSPVELKKRVRDAIQLCLAVAKKNLKYRESIRQFAYDPTFVGMDMVTL